MGQKTNPIGLRLGIIKGWDSNWYGGKNFGEKLVEDDKIRKYLFARLSKAGVSKIQIERTLKLVTVTIHTARPGIIIGKGGQEVDKLKEELKKLTGKEMQINITEIKRPELDAYLVANNIARQIEGRISFRRAIKTAIASTMRIGAEGIKVLISGRLGGAEMARREMYKEVPPLPDPSPRPILFLLFTEPLAGVRFDKSIIIKLFSKFIIFQPPINVSLFQPFLISEGLIRVLLLYSS
jgi:small subunit ribosomal protein S3